MRRLILATLASAALSTGGCRFCQGPDDYCGPVYWDGVPVIGFCERHNSVLSPGTFSSRDDEFVEDETVVENDESIDYVFDSPGESPVIRTQPQTTQQPTPAQPHLKSPVPDSSPAPAQSPQQWTPPKSTTPMKTSPAPGPIRTTRMR
ncbi:MAG: hypothetical protein JNM18_02750 [Planctomycetaceae bacterium]|nr:hypothetical protein [Planctomycetaceae bacterium]